MGIFSEKLRGSDSEKMSRRSWGFFQKNREVLIMRKRGENERESEQQEKGSKVGIDHLCPGMIITCFIFPILHYSTLLLPILGSF